MGMMQAVAHFISINGGRPSEFSLLLRSRDTHCSSTTFWDFDFFVRLFQAQTFQARIPQLHGSTTLYIGRLEHEPIETEIATGGTSFSFQCLRFSIGIHRPRSASLRRPSSFGDSVRRG
ncbi:hypothetical protein QR680_002960 [Steinernema hermaphroditum]|uniref:Uncharacterized protein n=1 Tax=Steinernema hermaphroditum TaxID=289476 RepID=A0AA39H7F3_9BILA|nr:hypothetical protein QR680_002960 [Steinernema hermaphroditum]